MGKKCHLDFNYESIHTLKHVPHIRKQSNSVFQQDFNFKFLLNQEDPKSTEALSVDIEAEIPLVDKNSVRICYLFST